jgi:Carboxypeptidase regulatory-like domain
MALLSFRLPARLCAIVLVFLGGLFAARVQAQAPTGTVVGSVTAAPLNVELAFAVVSIPQLSIERFTDVQGRFSIGALPPGDYEIIVRRIGFRPFRGSVKIEAERSTQLDVQLIQLPAQLATRVVQAMTRCPRPGTPDRERDPIVAQLVELLKENADRYRLLARDHPFRYLQLRAMGLLRDSGFVVQQLDTLMIVSLARGTYRPGNIVGRVRAPNGGVDFVMHLPTILDLADDLFARNHCFAYAGVMSHSGETWLRLDVRAADAIRGPDVHGSFYIDSASSELRRMDLSMSRADRLPVQLRNVEAVEVITSFVGIAPGLSIIDQVCGLNRLRRPAGTGVRSTPTELQHLLGFEFASPPPGIRKSGTVAPPALWQSGATLPRDVVWCAP